MEFFREAPLGAIILVVAGAIVSFVIATPLQISAARQRAQREKNEAAAKETGVPPLITSDEGTRTAALVNVAGYALMAAGLAIWIFD